MHNIMRCDGLFKAILFGNVVAVASLTTYNQDSFVVVFGSEVLHRRVRQDDLFRIDLLIRGNCVILVVPFLFSSLESTLTPTNSLIWRAFSSSVTPPPLVNKTNGTFLYMCKLFFFCFYLMFLFSILPVRRIITVQHFKRTVKNKMVNVCFVLVTTGMLYRDASGI